VVNSGAVSTTDQSTIAAPKGIAVGRVPTHHQTAPCGSPPGHENEFCFAVGFYASWCQFLEQRLRFIE
jgi:hypothetical protein